MMRIFDFFRRPEPAADAPPPAAQAKERLQIVMAHERAGREGPDFLVKLQQELLAVISKYVDIDSNKVEVRMDRGQNCSTLEVNVELPRPAAGARQKPAAGKPERPQHGALVERTPHGSHGPQGDRAPHGPSAQQHGPAAQQHGQGSDKGHGGNKPRDGGEGKKAAAPGPAR